MKIPIEDHPGTLFGLVLPVANCLLGLPPDDTFGGRMNIKNIVRHPGKKFNIGRNLNSAEFGRMLAKTAHAFPVAELGLSGFRPVLLPLILGDGTAYLNAYVGGGTIPEPAPTDEHELRLDLHRRLDGQQFIVVRIRLFAKHDMPAYYVVAGTPAPS